MAEEKIQRNFRFLVRNVTPIPILDILIQHGFENAEGIRLACRNQGPDEANRQIIEGLKRMKDGRGHEHYIEALKEEEMTHVLAKLGYSTGESIQQENSTESTQMTYTNTQPANNTAGCSISIDGAHLNESDGPKKSSQIGKDDIECDATDAACGGHIDPERDYESYRKVAVENEHHYEPMEDSGMNVRLLQPTTLLCPKHSPSEYPNELSPLTKDAAWHAYINDTTIHKAVKNLCKCSPGTYIMWYSTVKRAMLVSVAVPEIPKRHVHFKMLRKETDGVPYYYFDSRLHDKDPQIVLKYAKEHGLIINAKKLTYYQSQSS